MSGRNPEQLFSYIKPDARFQNIVKDASEHSQQGNALRMASSNILAMPASTSASLAASFAAITKEFSERYLPKILDPTSEHRFLLRDHSSPLKVKLRNNPLIFVLEDGDFTLDGLLFAVCIPIFGLENSNAVAVREGSQGVSAPVSKWEVGNMVVVPGRHQLVYSAEEQEHRCTFLFLPYIKGEADVHS